MQTSKTQPRLIFSSNDVVRIPESDINTVSFPSADKEAIARRLHGIAVLERRLETESRSWDHNPEVKGELLHAITEEMTRAKQEMYDIFLETHDFPKKPSLLLTPSEYYSNVENGVYFLRLPFRSSDLREIASTIDQLMSFENELNKTLTNAYVYDFAERRAMITNTETCLRQTKQWLVQLLTGK